MSKLSQIVYDLIKKGYPPDYITEYLGKYGYKASDVEQAIEEVSFSISAEPTHVKHTHHLASSGIIMLMMLIVFVVGGITLLLKVTGVVGNPALLDLETEPEKLSLKAGEELRFTLKVLNMGRKEEFDAFVKYKLTDSLGRKLMTKEETFAVSTSVTRDKVFESPKEKGTYKLSVIANYNDRVATSSFSFNVMQEPTKDSQKQVSAAEIIEKVENFVEAKQYNKAETLCLDMKDKADADDCLSFIVRESRNPGYCKNIEKDETRDNCYMSFIVEGQTYFCSEVVLESNLNYCDRVADVQLLAKYYQAS